MRGNWGQHLHCKRTDTDQRSQPVQASGALCFYVRGRTKGRHGKAKVVRCRRDNVCRLGRSLFWRNVLAFTEFLMSWGPAKPNSIGDDLHDYLTDRRFMLAVLALT